MNHIVALFVGLFLVGCGGSYEEKTTGEFNEEKGYWAGHMSGVPGIHRWGDVVEWIRKDLGMDEKRIHDLTFGNANKTFGLDLVPRVATPELNIEAY